MNLYCASFLRLAEHFDARHDRHVDVAQHQVEGLRRSFLQAFRAIFGFDNFIARARKSHLDQLANGQGIVDR